MKNENELKALLDRLREEMRVSPDQHAPAPAPAAKPLPAAEAPRYRAPAPAARPLRRDLPAIPGPDPRRFDRQRPASPDNLVWSENKEAMLLGVLASLAAALAGLLGSRDYLVLAGTVSFLLFSCVMVLTLFGYYLNFKGTQPPPETPSSARLEQLSRRLDSLEEKLLSGRSAASAGPEQYGADGELARKVEELRTIVKSLAKAVDGTALPGEGAAARRKDYNKEV